MADKLQLWETFDEFSAFFGGYRNLLAVLGKKTFPLDSPSICIAFFIHGLYFFTGFAWVAKTSLSFCLSLLGGFRVYVLARLLAGKDLASKYGGKWAGNVLHC